MATVAISGITAEQTAALAGIQVGDILLIRKVDRYDDDEEDYDEDDENEGSDEDEGSNEDDVESDPESEVSDHSEDESDEQNEPDDTSATEIPVPARVYVISAITKDSTSGDITDLDLVHLQYSSAVGSPHTYQVYGKQVSHDHSATCGQQGSECQTLKIADIVNHQDFRIDAKPTGDLVRRVDQEVWTANPHTLCIAGCVSGFLPHGHNLQTMISKYIPPTTTTGMPMPRSYQAPICPVCVGVDLLKEQQILQANLMLMGMVDIGSVVEFLSRVNPRRRELGYPFEQFDEREWGFGEFDDMLPDDEAGENHGNGRWEQWDEAMDPNSAVQNRPASTATIASLPRMAFGEIKQKIEETSEDKNEEEITNCKVCLDKFEEDSMLVELPCGHTYYHEDCIEQWLKQFNNCPTCRREVPAVKETATTAEEDQAAQDSVGDVVAAEMDGDDAVMSDV